jgi:hypothetical protein
MSSDHFVDEPLAPPQASDDFADVTVQIALIDGTIAKLVYISRGGRRGMIIVVPENCRAIQTERVVSPSIIVPGGNGKH